MPERGEKESRRVQMTKRLLREAMTELMEREGAGKITVRALCERADVNRSTFYAYYGDPYDLVDEMERDVLREMPGIAAASLEELRPVLERFFAYLDRNRRVLRVLLRNAVGDHFRQRVMDTLLGSYRRGSDWPRDVDVRDKKQLELLVYTSGCFTLTEKWLLDEIRCAPEEMARIVCSFAVV